MTTFQKDINVYINCTQWKMNTDDVLHIIKCVIAIFKQEFMKNCLKLILIIV